MDTVDNFDRSFETFLEPTGHRIRSKSMLIFEHSHAKSLVLTTRGNLPTGTVQVYVLM